MFEMHCAAHFMKSIRFSKKPIQCTFFDSSSHLNMVQSAPQEYGTFSLSWPAITNSSEVIGLLVQDERVRGGRKVLFALSNLDTESPHVEFMHQDGCMIVKDLHKELLSELAIKHQLPAALTSALMQACHFSEHVIALSV